MASLGRFEFYAAGILMCDSKRLFWLAGPVLSAAVRGLGGRTILSAGGACEEAGGDGAKVCEGPRVPVPGDIERPWQAVPAWMVGPIRADKAGEDRRSAESLFRLERFWFPAAGFAMQSFATRRASRLSALALFFESRNMGFGRRFVPAERGWFVACWTNLSILHCLSGPCGPTRHGRIDGYVNR